MAFEIYDTHTKVYMLAEDILENIIAAELQARCLNCAYFDDCKYRKKTNKVIIQCESFQARHERPAQRMLSETAIPKGLCTTCSKVSDCTLLKDQLGVWHCEAYE